MGVLLPGAVVTPNGFFVVVVVIVVSPGEM